MYKINLRNRAFYTSSFQKQVFLAYLSQSLGYNTIYSNNLEYLNGVDISRECMDKSKLGNPTGKRNISAKEEIPSKTVTTVRFVKLIHLKYICFKNKRKKQTKIFRSLFERMHDSPASIQFE